MDSLMVLGSLVVVSVVGVVVASAILFKSLPVLEDPRI